MRATIPLSALSLAVAATLVVATPAAAAPFTDGDVEVGGTTWRLEGLSSGDSPYISQAERDDWDGGSYTFDDGILPIFIETGIIDLSEESRLSCAADGDLSAAADATGDQIVACPLQPFDSGNGTLNATFELRFFSDGATVRARLIVTNESASVVSGAHVGFYDNYYQDDDTRVGASTTEGHPAAADSTVVDGDLLWIIYDALIEDDYEVPVILTAAGTADAAVLPVMGDAAGNGDDVQETLYPLPDLAPGQTVEIVQFWVWNFFGFDPEPQPSPSPSYTIEPNSAPSEADAGTERLTVETVTEEGFIKSSFLEPAALFVPSALAAVQQSWDARARFASLSTRDAAGIADPSRVLNWKLLALADTGPSDSALPLAAFAGLLLLAGAGVVAVRRRPDSVR